MWTRCQSQTNVDERVQCLEWHIMCKNLGRLPGIWEPILSPDEVPVVSHVASRPPGIWSAQPVAGTETYSPVPKVNEYTVRGGAE